MYRLNIDSTITNLKTYRTFAQDDRLEAYNEYVEWLRAGNGPTFETFEEYVLRTNNEPAK